MNEITEVLPELLRHAISAVPEETWRDTEEIRIRVDRPVELIGKDNLCFCHISVRPATHS